MPRSNRQLNETGYAGSLYGLLCIITIFTQCIIAIYMASFRVDIAINTHVNFVGFFTLFLWGEWGIERNKVNIRPDWGHVAVKGLIAYHYRHVRNN